jgi:hypothetical protein
MSGTQRKLLGLAEKVCIPILRLNDKKFKTH